MIQMKTGRKGYTPYLEKKINTYVPLDGVYTAQWHVEMLLIH